MPANMDSGFRITYFTQCVHGFAAYFGILGIKQRKNLLDGSRIPNFAQRIKGLGAQGIIHVFQLIDKQTNRFLIF